MVRLALVGTASPIAVEMFVAGLPRRDRSQRFDDLAVPLASDARLLPVRTASRVWLVAKHAIAWVSVAHLVLTTLVASRAGVARERLVERLPAEQRDAGRALCADALLGALMPVAIRGAYTGVRTRTRS